MEETLTQVRRSPADCLLLQA